MFREIVATMMIFTGAFGCSDEAPPVGTVQTVIAGELSLSLGAAPRAVDVFEWADGARGALVCETESDNAGAWSCDVAPYIGDVFVRVRLDDTTAVEAVVDGVEVGKGRSGIQVTPVTHLIFAYTEHLIAEGMGWPEALRQSRRLIHGHFGRLDHGRVAAADIVTERPSVVTDQVVVGMLLVGFDALAAELAAANNETLLTPWVLMKALEKDIRNDGFFDGAGAGGPVLASTARLDGNTLRTDYARAILGWLDSDANETALERADFEPLANAIGQNMSAIFPSDVPPPVDQEGPMVTYFEFRTERDGVVIDTSRPLRGSWHIEARAEDRSGVASFAIEVVEAPDHAFGAIIVDDAEYKRWPFESSTLPRDGVFTIRVIVTDGLGNETVVTRAFVADNTAPVSTFSAAGVVAMGTVRVTGTSTDAIGPIEAIVIQGGASRIEVTDPSLGIYDVTLNIACGAVVPVVVRATDAAGNEGAESMDVRCDDVPPELSVQPTTYRQESSLDAVYASDGASVAYQWTANQAAVTLDDSGAPITLTKYFTRFDSFAPNLPKLVWVAHDRAGTHTSSYRYLVNDVEVREWTDVTPVNVVPGQSLYELDLSYQSLDARLGRGREADVHRVELRAVDEAGNETTTGVEFNVQLLSPPVWIGGCQLNQQGLQNFTLADRTLRDIYVRPPMAPPVDLMSARVRYGTETLAASMMAPAPALVSIDALVTSRITELSEDVHHGPQYVPGGFGDVCAATANRRIDAAGVWSGACRLGVKPLSEVFWDRGVDGPVNDEAAVSPTVVVLAMNGTPVGRNGMGEHRVGPVLEHQIATALSQPSIAIGGSVYDWPEMVTVPSGYTLTQQPPRYRVPAFDGRGVDYVSNSPANYPRWVSRAYISGFELESGPVVASARHETLLDMEVDVVLAPACQQALIYGTSL